MSLGHTKYVGNIPRTSYKRQNESLLETQGCPKVASRFGANVDVDRYPPPRFCLGFNFIRLQLGRVTHTPM